MTRTSHTDTNAETDARQPAASDDSDPGYHAARAALYCAAAAAFTYPDERTVADLTAPDARAGIERAADTVGVPEATALVDAVAATSLSDLRSAYDALFGIPGGNGDEGGDTYHVIPYEAHYTTRDEISSEQRRIATVVGLMRTFGVEPDDGFAERQDHVAAELELAQVLAGQRAVALEDGDDAAAARIERAEATLLDEHLAEFVPALADDLRGATDEPAYAAAADLVEALVMADDRCHSGTGADPEAGSERRDDCTPGGSADGDGGESP